MLHKETKSCRGLTSRYFISISRVPHSKVWYEFLFTKEEVKDFGPSTALVRLIQFLLSCPLKKKRSKTK